MPGHEPKPPGSGKNNLTLTRLSETPAVSGSALVGLIEKVGV